MSILPKACKVCGHRGLCDHTEVSFRASYVVRLESELSAVRAALAELVARKDAGDEYWSEKPEQKRWDRAWEAAREIVLASSALPAGSGSQT